MEFFQDLMAYEFLQKAFITSIMVGIICGVIGSFIILRGMALMGEQSRTPSYLELRFLIC